jgi:NAD(P) transhydrogenase subunit beta
MGIHVLALCYLIASVTFILGLKMLSRPETARQGNLIAAAGMAIGILGTIFLFEYEHGGIFFHLHHLGYISRHSLLDPYSVLFLQKKYT